MIPLFTLMFLGLALMALILAFIGIANIPQYGSGPRSLFAHLFKHPFGPPTFGLANIAEGQHPKGVVTRLPDVQVPCGADGGRRYFLAKSGAFSYSAALAGATDIPIGVWKDSTDRGSFGGTTVTDLTIPLAIQLFGSGAPETGLVSINSNVAQGDLLVCDANGYAKTKPAATAGVFYVFGRALQAGAAGDNIEFDPVLPEAGTGFQAIFAAIGVSTTSATADHVLIAGLLATDVVNVTLNTAGGAETTVLKAAAAAGQVNITTDAAAVAGTTKYNIVAFRAINS